MLQVVYIPGLGDDRITLQRLAVSLWRVWGVQPHMFHVRWGDGEAYTTKSKRLLALIDSVAQQGPVALVGISAGASAVINTYAARPEIISGAVCIAGKINNPQTISKRYLERAPAFWESAHLAPAALLQLSVEQRQRILSLRATTDRIVPARDSIIEHAHNEVVWTRGHIFTNAWQLVFGAPHYLRFLKRQLQQ